MRRRRPREGQAKRKRKRENRRSILKILCAALLRSFRGQHSEKIKGSFRGNWDPMEGQQPFRPNPNGAGDHTTTLRRLLIGATKSLSLIQSENYSFMASFDKISSNNNKIYLLKFLNILGVSKTPNKFV